MMFKMLWLQLSVYLQKVGVGFLKNCVRKRDSQDVYPEAEKEHSQDGDGCGNKEVFVHQKINLE